jgi:hypothetical protein
LSADGKVQVHRWPEFDAAIAKLKRKYPRVEQDLARAFAVVPAPEELASRIVALPGFSHKPWKFRIGASDMARGTRGGFRIIFYMNPNPKQRAAIYLLTIYAKTERADIPRDQMEAIFRRFWTHFTTPR